MELKSKSFEMLCSIFNGNRCHLRVTNKNYVFDEDDNLIYDDHYQPDLFGIQKYEKGWCDYGKVLDFVVSTDMNYKIKLESGTEKKFIHLANERINDVRVNNEEGLIYCFTNQGNLIIYNTSREIIKEVKALFLNQHPFFVSLNKIISITINEKDSKINIINLKKCQS